MKWLTNSRLLIIALALTATVNILAVLIWGKTLAWDPENVSFYSLFPLLGLLAFSTMLAQYVTVGLKKLAGLDTSPQLHAYFNYSGLAVTSLIVLHPSLLVWQLWRDGLGLPPTSYYSYVAPSLKWALMLGVFSLFIFLTFELRHRYRQASWWKYIDHAQDIAIVAIYFHAFKLLAAVLLYKYYGHYQESQGEN
jgi:hypothetical protein